jgi:hypothetical protein
MDTLRARQTKRTHFTLFLQRLVKNKPHLHPVPRQLFPFYDTGNPSGDGNNQVCDRLPACLAVGKGQNAGRPRRYGILKSALATPPFIHPFIPLDLTRLPVRRWISNADAPTQSVASDAGSGTEVAKTVPDAVL